jgi:anti-sigma regulatory factor (Ser/Thr protein kinase)
VPSEGARLSAVTSPPDHSVRLNVPATVRFLSPVRVVAAALGADCGLSVDDLDDLRLGVNEMVSALVDGAPPAARVALEFAPTDGQITVTGTIEGGGPDGVVVDELTTRILDAVADHHTLDGMSFELTKRSSLHEPT